VCDVLVSVIEPVTLSNPARLKLEPSGDVLPRIEINVAFGEIVAALARSQVCVYHELIVIRVYLSVSNKSSN